MRRTELHKRRMPIHGALYRSLFFHEVGSSRYIRWRASENQRRKTKKIPNINPCQTIPIKGMNFRFTVANAPNRRNRKLIPQMVLDSERNFSEGMRMMGEMRG
jgi:hypothetical protein